MRRSPKLRFFGGFDAFPGGVMDPADRDAATDSEFDAFRRVAVRELFEETGVLLAGPDERARLDRTSRERLRTALLAAPRADVNEGASQIVGQRAGETPIEPDGGWREVQTSPSLLTPLLEITTPPFAPRRYRTLFFHATLPADEAPEIIPGELTGGEFIAPSRAIEEWRRGERWIAPPVLLVLELLDRHGLERLAEVTEAEQRALEAGRLHPVRFSPGIFVAPLETRTKPPATTTNCFLVGERRVAIVDPASADERELGRLYDKLDAYRAEGRTLTGILLTHSHPDHVGGVVPVAERYGLTVHAHPEALRRLDLPVPTEPVHDGARFELGIAPDGSEGWFLEAIATPGHSPDHLAFEDSRYRTLIAGDLLSSLSTVVIDPPEGHLATYLSSLERIATRSVSMIYPSHGPAVRDGARMLETYLRHRRARESKLVRALEAGCVSLDELLAVVYDDADASVLHLARRSLLAALIKLREEGRATSDDDQEWRLTPTSS